MVLLTGFLAHDYFSKIMTVVWLIAHPSYVHMYMHNMQMCVMLVVCVCVCVCVCGGVFHYIAAVNNPLAIGKLAFCTCITVSMCSAKKNIAK